MKSNLNTLLTSLGVVLFALWSTGCYSSREITTLEEAKGDKIRVHAYGGKTYELSSYSMDTTGTRIYGKGLLITAPSGDALEREIWPSTVFFEGYIEKGAVERIEVITPSLGAYMTPMVAQDKRDAPPQSTPSSSAVSVYLELFGACAFYSVNADWRITQYIAARVGYSSITTWNIVPFSGTQLEAVPLGVSVLLGNGTHSLEIGGCIVFNRNTRRYAGSTSTFGQSFLLITNVTYWYETTTHPYYSGTLGYRYQPLDGGMMFRLTFTPLSNFGRTRRFVPLGGISFGVTF